MGENRIDRHGEIGKKLLKLSKTLLAEGTEHKDIKVTNLAIMFLVINGTLLDNKSFTRLYNQVKLFSNAELFQTLMDSDLKSDILRTISKMSIKDEDLDNALGDAVQELKEELEFETCLCEPQNMQPYDGKLYEEHIGFCLNCGGKIE